MDSPRQHITAALQKTLQDLGIEEKPVLSIPSDSSHGDYTSNIALAIFSNLKSQMSNLKSPMDLVEKIVGNLKLDLPAGKAGIGNLKFIDKIDAVKPGFINFYLSKEYLLKQLSLLSSSFWEATTSPESDSGQARMTDFVINPGSLSGKKVIVEFTDPNPFKEFHIGHLYSNVVGESLSRLLESQGAQVWRVTYQGDVGLHVAKAIYGLLHSSEFGVQSSELDKKLLTERVKILGQAYAFGAAKYEEDESAKQEINMLNKKIYEQDPSVLDIYKKGKAWSLDYFETIYKRLGTAFVTNYFESEAGSIGIALVKEHIKDGVFKESEGAVIFEGKQYGLHNRVFINSLGLPTYEAKDMGLPQIKYKDFPYDRSIIITAHEQSEYFKVVLKALSLISPDLAAKTKHIAHGMVRLPSGKMSSRKGEVLTGEWLLDETLQQILKNYKEMDQKTAEKVAVGAVKYALLKSGIGRDTIFNFEESISFEGNSGPYLQYTYARTRSVLAKFQISNSKFQINTNDWKLDIGNLKLEIEEVSLLRLLNRFQMVVEEAAMQFAPNVLCTYLFELAQKFNLFYQKCPILGSEKEQLRLALTKATGKVLSQGLNLLGIQAPERM